jgi:hypothetical protein
MANIAVVIAGGGAAGILALDMVQQSVVQVPGEPTRSFRRTTDPVLLLFHTWGKRAYLLTFRVP